MDNKDLLNEDINNSSIYNIGKSKSIEKHLQEGSLYLHPARGEAWGLSINEAMLAGLVPIISEFTGTRELVNQVDSRLVCPLDESKISEGIIWYFNLPIAEKKALSEKSRIVARKYTEEEAVSNFKQEFTSVLEKI